MSSDLPRVLVVGAGSIGARHARNLLQLGAAVSVSDPDPARAAAVDGAMVAPAGLDDLESYDAVVVASPTSLHARHAAAVLGAGLPVLVEKPLAIAVSDATALATSDKVMVGYNLRFHEPLRRLRAMTADGMAGTIRLARFWFGSYLPSWRPGTDYRSSYSAQAALGGGVLLDAIHELDLVVWWFGSDVDVAGAVMAHTGTLDIDVEDAVQAVLRSGDGVPITVSLDYLSRGYRRGVELVGDDATLRFDWQRQELEIETGDGRQVERIDVPVSRSYELEAAHFLEWVAGRATPPVGAAEGLASLRLAGAIASAAR